MTDGAPSRSHGALLRANDDMTVGQSIAREVTALPRFFSTAQQRRRGSCRNDLRAGGRAPMRAAATMCPTRTKGARGPSGFLPGQRHQAHCRFGPQLPARTRSRRQGQEAYGSANT